jgi:hypothetical protein
MKDLLNFYTRLILDTENVLICYEMKMQYNYNMFSNRGMSHQIKSCFRKICYEFDG